MILGGGMAGSHYAKVKKSAECDLFSIHPLPSTSLPPMTEVPIYHLEEKEYDAPYYQIRTDYEDNFFNSNTPLVIDNGAFIISSYALYYSSTQPMLYRIVPVPCRLGHTIESSMYVFATFSLDCILSNVYLVIFDSVVSRYKDRKANVNMLAVGMDAYADPAGRSNARSPFDGNVVCDFDRMVRLIYDTYTVYLNLTCHVRP